MTRALALPPADVDRIVRRWMTDQLAAPHPRLGRPGAICPYLGAALARDLVVVRGRAWELHEPDPPAVVADVIERAVIAFLSHQWPATSRPDLRALVVVFTGMPRHAWPAIDAVHAEMKSSVVERGLMIGQFHPACAAGAIHNPRWPVLRSPYPLVAIHPMALHDLYFLHSNAAWFDAYQTRFGHLYGREDTPAGLAALYDQAVARFRPVPRRRGKGVTRR